MPSIDIKFWNAQDAGAAKAQAALTALRAWAPATPGIVPAFGHSHVSVCCEALVHTNGYLPPHFPPNPLQLGNHVANMIYPTVWPSAAYVSARWRTNLAARRAQLGYAIWHANGIAPTTIDRPIPPLPNWLGLPANILGNNRPNVDRVRRKQQRRLLTHHPVPNFQLYYFHALSGGGASTIYDLRDQLDLISRLAPGQVAVLVGDLNLAPALINPIFPALPAFLNWSAPPLIASPPGGIAGAIANNQATVLCPANPTQRSGGTLDYAVVFNRSGTPLNWFLVDGWSGAAAAPIGPSPAGWPGGAANPCHIPAGGGFTSDHKPIFLRLRF